MEGPPGVERIHQVHIVALVNLRPMRSGDVPSSPALIERGALIGHKSASMRGTRFAGDGVNGTDQQSGNAEGNRSLMAPQAIAAARKRGPGGVLKHVKLHTLRRIERR